MLLAHREILRLYDEHVTLEADAAKRINYLMSRPKFVALLEVLAQEEYDSLLEIGISEFCGLLKHVYPSKRVGALGLHVPALRWSQPDGVDLVQGDLLSLDPRLDLGQFDVVLCSEVIEHVQGNPRTAFAALLRFVRPGGRLIVTTPNLARLFNRIKLLLGWTPLERIGPAGWAGHFREYTRGEIVEFLQASGFVVEIADYRLYWDGVDVYLQGGERGFNEQGEFYCNPRYAGWRGTVALPLLLAVELLVKAIPSLRTGMVFVARRPNDPGAISPPSP